MFRLCRKFASLGSVIGLVWPGSLSCEPVERERVRLAELLAQPERYEGRLVRVRGNYRYGFEWDELYCDPMDKQKRVWLHLPVDAGDRLQRQLAKLPKWNGTISAVFNGVWLTNGPYGHNGHPFGLQVVAVEDVKVVSKSSAFPEWLREKERARLAKCSGD